MEEYDACVIGAGYGGAPVAALLAGQPINPEQVPSVGCNIKWRAGNEPDYF